MIEVWPMVRTEANMISNHINHHHINHRHYQPPPYQQPPHHSLPKYPLQYPQFNEFFYEEELRNSIYQCNDSEDDYEDETMVHGRRRRFANPNPNRRGRFSNSNKRDKFPNSIHDIGGEYSNPYEFKTPFDGSHDVEWTLLWIDKIDELFDMEYTPMKDQVEFVVHRLKGSTATWWDQF